MIQEAHDDTFSWWINKAYAWQTLLDSWCHRHWNRAAENGIRRVFKGGVRPKTSDTMIVRTTKVLRCLNVASIRGGRHRWGREVCWRSSNIGRGRGKGGRRLGVLLLGQWGDIREGGIGKADSTVMRGWLRVTREGERLNIGRIEGGGWGRTWRIDRD